MFSTRILRAGKNSLSGARQLLLPPPNFWESAGAALQGAWAHIFDQSARDKFEDLVEKNVIKDTVLQNATTGSTLIFALFHNLQDPLFEKYKFDAVEFMQAVGPALENFHDTLGCLKNDLPANIKEDRLKLEENLKKSDEELLGMKDNLTTSLLGANRWQQQAEEDENSPAGILSKMTTDICLEAFYYTCKLDILGRDALEADAAGVDHSSIPNYYIPGSCRVSEVALLNARALEMNLSEAEEIEEEYPEFRASEDNSYQKNLDVAAQLDVLYEVSHTYRLPSSPLSEADGDRSERNGGNDPATKPEDDSVNESVKDGEVKQSVETMVYTNLSVAVFEGWLHKTSDGKSGLRWKIAMIRDAYEFPHHQPTVITNPPST